MAGDPRTPAGLLSAPGASGLSWGRGAGWVEMPSWKQRGGPKSGIQKDSWRDFRSYGLCCLPFMGSGQAGPCACFSIGKIPASDPEQGLRAGTTAAAGGPRGGPDAEGWAI